MDTEFDVSVCVGAGIPAAKLGIGAACFGEGFLGCTAPEQAFASKVGGDGVFTYASVVSDYAPQMTRVWNDEAQEAYLWSPTPVGPHPATYVTYVDEQAMRAKAAYIADRAIGGIIFWHIAEQYLPGQPSGSRFPLLKVMAEELL